MCHSFSNPGEAGAQWATTGNGGDDLLLRVHEADYLAAVRASALPGLAGAAGAADSSGELLHRRGFRKHVHAAPLRETLAAGMVLTGLAGMEAPPNLGRVYSKHEQVKDRELARLDQSVPSGSKQGCVSEFGVYDLTGNFDEATIDEALRSNDWPGQMTEHEHRDLTYYAWNTGPDQHAAEATISNPTGVARRIALIENVYVIARTDPHMEALIETVRAK